MQGGEQPWLCVKALPGEPPQAQRNATDALVMQRMLPGSLRPAYHVLTLKGCPLLAWSGEGPAPGALVVPVLTSHTVQASLGLDEPRYLCISPKKHWGPLLVSLPGLSRWL